MNCLSENRHSDVTCHAEVTDFHNNVAMSLLKPAKSGPAMLVYINLFLTITIAFLLIWLPAVSNVYAVNLDYSFENTQIGTYKEGERFADYNRLRLKSQVDDDRLPGLSATVIVDNRTHYSREDDFDNELVLHRGYLEYGTEKHLLIAGRQRIPFGVGRIWNPIDIFNPVDSTSIEPVERQGVDAIRYEYAISELSNFDLTVAKDRGSARLKGFLGGADMALVTVIDNDEGQIIIGWEIEGELGDTGIDLRSEGGSFYDRSTKEYHTEFIIGGEYGFANSLTFLLEYYYNDDTAVDHFGITISCQPFTLLTFNILAMINLDDHSTLLAPTLSYSLSDEMTLAGGLFLYNGENGDGFGDRENMVFIKWFVHF